MGRVVVVGAPDAVVVMLLRELTSPVLAVQREAERALSALPSAQLQQIWLALKRAKLRAAAGSN